MVDYSKFANIDVESSSESDAGMEVKHQTFRYPLGAVDPRIGLFDVRDEACQPYGFRHGDVVVTDFGEVCTVIGVHGTSLYFHKEGSPGAATWPKTVPLKAIARTTVKEGHPKGPPSARSEWLKLDFPYAKGLQEVTIEHFDTRDHICKQVGGFTHGQVIEVQDLLPMVTIGVNREKDGRLFLWFHQEGSPGAGICDADDLKRAKVVGSKVVRQVTSAHECRRSDEHETFAFPIGDVDPHLEWFDIRAEACAPFGFQHGDVVITDNGVPSTVIGVRADSLWFHMEGSPGASLWPPDERLKVIAHTTVSAKHAKRGPSHSADWLKLDFSYACGLHNPTIETFDTRDSICFKVGGFKHGQSVQVPGMSKPSVTIGVRRSADGRVLLWFHVKGEKGAGLHRPEDLKRARVRGLVVVREMHSVCSPSVRERAVPPSSTDRAAPPSPRKGCAHCRSLREELKKEQQDREREKKALETETTKLRKDTEQMRKEMEKMQKKLAQLRASNGGLIKSTSRASEQAERKERLKRENIAQEMKQELEDETREHLMKNLIQPKLESLQLESESIQKQKDSIEETSQQLALQKAQVQQSLEDNARDTRRLMQALQQREQDAHQLRQETRRLEEEIARQAAEKAALAKRLSEQPLRATADEETWQFLSSSEVWTPYSEPVDAQIMEAFMKGSDTCKVACEGTEYEIDFKLQTQMNCRTQKRRRVRCYFGLPPHWLMSDEDALRRLRGERQEAREGGSDCSASQSAGTVLTTISEFTRGGMRANFKEYATKITDLARLEQFEVLLQKCLVRQDGTACPCGRNSVFRVREVYQVQNLYLWRRYQRFCRTIRDKQKQYNIVPEQVKLPVALALEDLVQQLQVNTDRNERLLFHGTKSYGYAKAIASEGFDNRVAQRGLYGQGTYFASQTCKSAQYGIPDARRRASHGRVGTMILSRVALGDPFYATGPYDEARPPTKKALVPGVDSDDEDERDILCDSVIARPGILRNGSPQLHAEFVTFAPEQVYPEFILRYTEE